MPSFFSRPPPGRPFSFPLTVASPRPLLCQTIISPLRFRTTLSIPLKIFFSRRQKNPLPSTKNRGKRSSSKEPSLCSKKKGEGNDARGTFFTFRATAAAKAIWRSLSFSHLTGPGPPPLFPPGESGGGALPPPPLFPAERYHRGQKPGGSKRGMKMGNRAP